MGADNASKHRLALSECQFVPVAELLERLPELVHGSTIPFGRIL
jgi:hypothetical protein